MRTRTKEILGNDALNEHIMGQYLVENIESKKWEKLAVFAKIPTDEDKPGTNLI